MTGIADRLPQPDELEELPLEPGEAGRVRATALRRDEPYDPASGVFERVARLAAEVPGRPAVSDAGTTLSYGELAEAVRAVAGALVADGPLDDRVVGVLGERTAHTVVAFLAVEASGGVYLPLDREWPPARLEQVVKASGADTVLLTNPVAAATRAVPAQCGCRVVDVVEAMDGAARSGVVFRRPEDVAYVLYTSGSTGAPKGAVLERRGLVNHLLAKIGDLGLTQDDVVVQNAPLTFDVSIWQLVAALLVGGATHVVGDDEAHAAPTLLASLESAGATVLEIVPTMLRLLLDEHLREGSALGRLRWLVTTGEELPPALAREWFEAVPGVPLLNAYGPTECADDVAHCALHEPPEPDAARVPIGRPVANTRLYVLRRADGSWRACARGETGELFVAGDGVGRGYVGDLEQTRRAFFRDPFDDSPTGRIYRTGDAATIRHGEVWFLGRVDRQVKLRGVRIELDEVEAVLERHPAVGTCAVTVVEGARTRPLVARQSALAAPRPASSPRLVAYYRARGGVPPDDLRRFLESRLPLSMVPEQLVPLPSLPLTPNGKVDYRALPDPGAFRPAVAAYEPPASDLERAICEVWADTLGLDRVGRRDAFLELGGDSLLAMRIAVRLSKLTGRTVSLRDLLAARTPATLASTIAGRPSPRSDEASAPSRTRPGSCPLSVHQEGLYFLWRLVPESPYYTYQGMLVLEGALDLGRFRAAWARVLAEHPALLARIYEEGGEPRQELAAWPCSLGEPLDLRPLPSAEREDVFRARAAAQAARPFDLLRDPLLRAELVTMSDDEHRLLLTMHEIVLDGWGALVLFDRLGTLYEGAAAGTPVDGEAAFAAYLDWEQGFLDSPEVQEQAGFWRRTLAPPLPVLELPTDHPRPPLPSFRGEIVETVLEPDVVVRLDGMCNEVGVTRFTAILAAFALALTYHAGTDEAIVGAPMANRDNPEQIGVVGFLLNMLPLRVAPRLELPARTYLAEVGELVAGAFAASDFPFARMLRDVAQPARDSSRTPVFQVMLNMLNYPKQRTSFGGVRFDFVELDTGFTKYDCSLYVQEAGAQTLLLQLAFQTDLFAQRSAARFLESTRLALEAIVSTPDTPLGSLDLLPSWDRELLLTEVTGG